MKPQLPALMMPLSTLSGTAQAGNTLQGRATLTLPDGGCGADPTSAANSTVYIDGAFHGPAGNMPCHARDLAGFKRRISHTALNVRTRKKRFG